MDSVPGIGPPVPPVGDDGRMRTERSRRLPEGRTLTWVDVWRRQACATVEDYATEGAIDGVPVRDDELRRLLLGR